MEPTIYLFFRGNCLEAMTRYAEVLGGEILGVFRNGDAPDAGSRMPGGDDLVMNMSLRLGSATIMASDAPDQYWSRPQGGRVPEVVEICRRRNLRVTCNHPNRRRQPPGRPRHEPDY